MNEIEVDGRNLRRENGRNLRIEFLVSKSYLKKPCEEFEAELN
jgi:hypothetical protein